jgi:sialate O-acetylesterase
MKRKNYLLLLAALFASAIPAFATVKLASPFTSHMVLQRDMNVPVWGTADSGEQVTVTFAGQKISATAGADGKWRVDLKPLKASAESQTFTVTGSKTDKPIALDDVLVGEVWLASGQSNMDFSMSKKVKSFAGIRDEEKEIAAANYPHIRMFVGKYAKTYEPQTSVGGDWQVCSPETVPAFSAIGYIFARDLQKEINVPVGVIVESFGASTIESWIRREALAADPKMKPFLDGFDTKVTAFRTAPPAVVAPPPSQDVSATNAATGGTNAVAGARRGGRAGGAARDPVQDQHNPTVLFNGMIAPVIPFAIRGAIWDQGESIVGGGLALYPQLEATLIKDWRALWGQGEFPFYIVQLAGLGNSGSNRPEVREAQALGLVNLPNTGMAVTIDTGEPANVHPKNKQDVGDRLSRIALANVYGRKIEFSGPVYESMKVEGGTIRVNFSHLGGGLVAKGGEPLKWFEIAGADMKFIPAQAKIDGDSVIVSSPDVAAPAAARYAWVNFPDGCNLFNAAGLPAAQFRTDAPKP